jgi:PAS domain S-box-containing protein
MDCASEGLAVIDADGRYVEINHTYAEMHGTTVDELTGRHCRETLTPESEAALKRSLEDAEPGDELSHSCIAQRVSGDRFSKQLSLNVLEDELTVAVARDASDEPDTTDYAVDDGPTHEELLHTVGDVLYAFDRQGQFSFVNKTFCEVMAVAPDDILGAHFSEITAEVDIPEAETAFESVAAEETDRIEATYQKRIKTGAGDWLPVETHIKRLPGDEFRGVVGVVRDISQRKERSQKLEHRTNELDEVTSFISHNMKSPLTGLSGSLHAMSTDDTELKKAAIDSVQRLEKMVTSISSLTAEDWRVTHTTQVSLREVAREAWRHVGGGSETTFQNNFTSHDTVEANREKVMSLFENLFTNAIDHCSAPDVTVTATRRGFKISDDGPGIPEDKRDDIFNSGFSDGDSTGIGLAHSQKIVAAHDWTMTAEESETGGTAFRIETQSEQLTTPESRPTTSTTND